MIKDSPICPITFSGGLKTLKPNTNQTEKIYYY